MASTPRTVTAAQAELPPGLEGPDVVTGLREYGRPGDHPLPTTQAVFSIGSAPSCDVRIVSEYISATHCALMRRGHYLSVQDPGSRNGTYFRGRRESAFIVAPGDTFNVATTKLIAINDCMRAARPILTEVLGADQESTIDNVLIESVLDRPLLIIGPRGSGQDDLVQVIHEMSVRRGHILQRVDLLPTSREGQKQLIVDASRGTVVFNAAGTIDDVVLDMMLSNELGPRLVILADSLEAARRSVKLTRLMQMDRIDIRPLRERGAEVEKPIELNLAKNGLCIRLAELRPENQQSLLRHHWPENLEELRHIAAIIAALARQRSVRKAAAVLDMPRSTMQYWIKRFDLKLPVTPRPIIDPL